MNAQPNAIYTPGFWQKAPPYDTVAFWMFALAQTGERDLYQRNMLVIGHGAAGPIRCARLYGESRLALLQERLREARKAKRLAKMTRR